MGHIHAQKSGVQSTKPKLTKLPTGAKPSNEEEEKDELLEQQKPPQPGVLLDQNERVGAHVIEFLPAAQFVHYCVVLH